MVKKAYLTIDDAPSETMEKKLDFLHKKKIPAIWFCNGDKLEQRPEMAIKAINIGHIIGNHSFNHFHFPELSLDECYDQINKADLLIDRIYKEAGVSDYPKYFRFPYGDKEVSKDKMDAIQSFLKKRGYTRPPFTEITYQYFHEQTKKDIDWLWSYDTFDWSVIAASLEAESIFGIDSIEKVFERMEEDVPEGGRGLQNADSWEIILIHDHLASTDIFPKIINRLLSKNIQFIFPPDATKFDWTMRYEK